MKTFVGVALLLISAFQATPAVKTVWDGVYTEEQARHISVHSRGILDALKTLYDAGPLVQELMAGR